MDATTLLLLPFLVPLIAAAVCLLAGCIIFVRLDLRYRIERAVRAYSRQQRERTAAAQPAAAGGAAPGRPRLAPPVAGPVGPVEAAVVALGGPLTPSLSACASSVASPSAAAGARVAGGPGG